MGVGNFKGSFEDVGESFIVDGADLSDDAYASYASEAGEDAMDQETWAHLRQDDQWDDIRFTVTNTLAEFDFTSRSEGHGHSLGRASFDTDFGVIASSDIIEVGVRSWESDLILSVAPRKSVLEMAQDPDVFAATIIDDYGMVPAEFADHVSTLCQKVSAAIRIALMESGARCSFRTGPWTSSAYELDANIDEVKKSIADDIAQEKAVLAEGWTVDKLTVQGPQRDILIKNLAHANVEQEPIDRQLACFAVVDGKVIAFDPVRGVVFERIKLPEATPEASLDLDGIDLVPADAAGQAYFAAVAELGNDLFPVGADEYERITGYDIDLSGVDEMIPDAPAVSM